MPESIRALVVVLVLAALAFFLSQRIVGSVVARREFAIWRNAWFAATIAGFLSGNLFLFAAVQVVICLVAHAARGATVALFIILIFVVPPAEVAISIPGAVNELVDLSNPRLLTVVLLLPILIATTGSGRRTGSTSALSDRIIVAYVLLLIALGFRKQNITSVMRNATQLTLDILVPYFAFSRTVTSVADFRKVFMAFVVAALPLSLIAVVETVKGWPLYNSFVENWSTSLGVSGREGMLRASASAGPIILGFILMVAIGCMIAIRQTTIQARKFAGIVLVLLTAGLIATLSRGPWVGVTVLVIIYWATGPGGGARVAFYATIGSVVVALLLQLPIVQHLADFLPFIGTVDSGSVTYRQLLFENSMPVIGRNLLFGSENFLSEPEMQSLLQGQQIVDMVNSFLGITLETGLVGLGLFLAFFGTILVGLRRVRNFASVLEPDFRVYARASTAILIAILVTIGTVSSISFVPYVYWSFAGLSVALIRIAYRERTVALRRALTTNFQAHTVPSGGSR
jgi:hypothetical protein